MKKSFAILALLATAACSGVPSNIDGDQVFFAFDSAEISKDAKKDLKKQALYLKKNTDKQITLQGRCDERGSTEYNLALGARRANAAKAVIVNDGVDSKRISTISYGKERPLVQGSGEEVWKWNRNATTTVK